VTGKPSFLQQIPVRMIPDDFLPEQVDKESSRSSWQGQMAWSGSHVTEPLTA